MQLKLAEPAVEQGLEGGHRLAVGRLGHNPGA